MKRLITHTVEDTQEVTICETCLNAMFYITPIAENQEVRDTEADTCEYCNHA